MGEPGRALQLACVLTSLSREASHGRMVDFVFRHLIHHHSCTPGPVATHFKTAKEELVQVTIVADRDRLAGPQGHDKQAEVREDWREEADGPDQGALQGLSRYI